MEGDPDGPRDRCKREPRPAARRRQPADPPARLHPHAPRRRRDRGRRRAGQRVLLFPIEGRHRRRDRRPAPRAARARAGDGGRQARSRQPARRGHRDLGRRPGDRRDLRLPDRQPLLRAVAPARRAGREGGRAAARVASLVRAALRRDGNGRRVPRTGRAPGHGLAGGEPRRPRVRRSRDDRRRDRSTEGLDPRARAAPPRSVHRARTAAGGNRHFPDNEEETS